MPPTTAPAPPAEAGEKGAQDPSKGCYKCGSVAGNAITLCPGCTTARIERAKGKQAEIAHKQKKEPPPGAAQVNSDQSAPSNFSRFLPVVAGVGGLVTAAWLALFSSYGPMWALSTPERAYKLCQSAVQEAAANSSSSQSGNAAAQAFGAGMLRGMVEGMCVAVREECRSNPTGTTCERALTLANR